MTDGSAGVAVLGRLDESIISNVPEEEETSRSMAFRRRGLIAAVGAVVMGLAVIGHEEEAEAAPFCCGPSGACACCNNAGSCCSKGCKARHGECKDVSQGPNNSDTSWYCCAYSYSLVVLCRDWKTANSTPCNCGEFYGVRC